MKTECTVDQLEFHDPKHRAVAGQVSDGLRPSMAFRAESNMMHAGNNNHVDLTSSKQFSYDP